MDYLNIQLHCLNSISAKYDMVSLAESQMFPAAPTTDSKKDGQIVEGLFPDFIGFSTNSKLKHVDSDRFVTIIFRHKSRVTSSNWLIDRD